MLRDWACGTSPGARLQHQDWRRWVNLVVVLVREDRHRKAHVVMELQLVMRVHACTVVKVLVCWMLTIVMGRRLCGGARIFLARLVLARKLIARVFFAAAAVRVANCDRA